MNVDIQLFDTFTVYFDQQAIVLPPKEREFFALLVVLGGGELTSKRYYEIIFKPQNLQYNARHFYSSTLQLTSLFMVYGEADFVKVSSIPVRSWKINPHKIKCDYYDMLDGKIPFREKRFFLPEYIWALELYRRSWGEVIELTC